VAKLIKDGHVCSGRERGKKNVRSRFTNGIAGLIIKSKGVRVGVLSKSRQTHKGSSNTWVRGWKYEVRPTSLSSDEDPPSSGSDPAKHTASDVSESKNEAVVEREPTQKGGEK
jgi:hypothetical protein